jgi:hypothetical protein
MPANYLRRHPIDEICVWYQDENVSYRDTLIAKQKLALSRTKILLGKSRSQPLSTSKNLKTC